MKKLLCVFLTALCLFASVPVFAYTASNVPKYLFDAAYYADKYADLKQAFGTNKTKLYKHWCDYGKSEGRSPSPVYDPSYYLNNNADLKKTFGTDYSALYNHFCTYGINEFRKSSEMYDGAYYKSHYADLQKAFGNNSKKYIEHFVVYGIKEGRTANGVTVVNEPIILYSSDYAEKTAWVKTSGSNLNLRKSATTKSSVVCKIPNNSQITVLGNLSNGFYKVKYGRYTGYASKDFIVFSKESQKNVNIINTNLIAENLPKIKLIKQGSKTCKATAVAQSLNIITGTNKYKTSNFGNASCTNINAKIYTGSDGNKYKATYKTDSYRGSAAEQLSQINSSLSEGLPIIVTVHKTGSGTKHHWVTVIGKSGNTYEIIDPATGTKRTMANAKYAFGLADYSNGYHYGYISFKKQ